jgi:hypothetical protein
MWWLTSAWAGPELELAEPSLDRSTLVSLGVRWAYAGDDDEDAVISIRYRELGGEWRDGMALLRVHAEDVVGFPAQREFAGSLFDLRPATSYELELSAVDPDGGGAEVLLEASTRPVPADPAEPVPVAVSTAAELADALADAAPGHVITLAEGTYPGPFSLEASGTSADPIVIRGASQLGVIVTGDGCADCNAIEVYGSHVHLERLTLAEANRALRFQGEGAAGNVVRHVLVRDVTLGIGSKEGQRDFVLCDNELRGPLAWPHVYTDDGGEFANVDGILVMGEGHVVCHNRLVGWGDAIKLGEPGGRAVDVYGNDISAAYDNGFEFDTASGNVRAFHNRLTNTYATLSFQPVYGGPVYAVRNLVVNVAHEQLKLHSLGYDEENVGAVILHNTFVSPERALTLSDNTTSHHFRVQGNLFVGPVGAQRVVEWTGGIDGGSFDGNGWFPDGRFDFGAAGDWDSFAQMQASGVFESSGRLLTEASPLASGVLPPASYEEELAPTEPTLGSGSEAIDAGLILPGLPGGWLGEAPDLGAHELGCPLPVYGPRAEGEELSLSCEEPEPEPEEPEPEEEEEPAGKGGSSEQGCGCQTASSGWALLFVSWLFASRRTFSRSPSIPAR